AQIGIRMGMECLAKYLERFGLLDQTHIDLPSDMRGRLGFGSQALEGGPVKVSRVAFGQSVLVTPLGMAFAYAALANNGVLMKPRLIRAYQDATGKTIREVKPQRVRQAVSPQTANYICSLLENVCINGTGKSAKVPGYTTAGKTGTAQKVVPGHKGYADGKYIASFIG